MSEACSHARFLPHLECFSQTKHSFVQAIECSLQVVPASGTGWCADVVDQIRKLFGETEVCTLIPLRKVGGAVEVSLVRQKDGN